MNVRNDFPMLKNNDIVYLDNGATTFKPQVVIDKIVDYYSNYTANAHRGDYNLSLKVDYEYEKTRGKVRKFINAKEISEIIFTSGTTESLNIIIKGFFRNHLNAGDEIILSKSEHASNLLPWYALCKEIGCVIKYIELDCDMKINIPNLLKTITDNTKVISLAHITNVVGDVRDIKKICEVAHQKGILVVCDGAQSIVHLKIDVIDMDVDFFCFSAHKMYGPTGVGILYGKKELLENVIPINLGGGMNSSFESLGLIEYRDLPHRLEAGTQNIAGIIGLSATIDYLNRLNIIEISNHEKNLRNYLIDRLLQIEHINIYNVNSEASVVSFNVDGVFAQDLAIYLNKYNICIRSGNHCAKILKEELGIKNTCRISLGVYNNKEDVDKLVSLLVDKEKILREII